MLVNLWGESRSWPAASVAVVVTLLLPPSPGSPSKLVWEAAVGPSVLENCTMESHVVTAVGMRYCCGGACTVGLKSLEPLLIIHIPREGGLGEHV